MKLFKKLLMFSLILAVMPKGLNASLPQSPSLLSRACSYVPFKTTLGLGLGLMATSAYCWYKLPQLESQLDKANSKPYLADPVMPKSEVRDVKAELKVIEHAQAHLNLIVNCKAKITPANKVLLININNLLRGVPHTDSLRAKAEAVREEYDAIEKLTVELMEEENEDVIEMATGLPYKSGKDFGKELYDADFRFCNFLDDLVIDCQSHVKNLNNYPKTDEYKAAFKKQQEQKQLHDRNVKTVYAHNGPIAHERLNLRNKILSYENIKFNCGVFGISLACLAGISKYFSR